jgi:hypothetical protein
LWSRLCKPTTDRDESLKITKQDCCSGCHTQTKYKRTIDQSFSHEY